MANPSSLKPFVKGDPRINRKGRPKTFDALRELAQSIAHEEAQNAGKPIVLNGHVVTVTEAILRSWASSKDPRLQQAFVSYAFGKPKDEIDAYVHGQLTWGEFIKGNNDTPNP